MSNVLRNQHNNIDCVYICAFHLPVRISIVNNKSSTLKKNTSSSKITSPDTQNVQPLSREVTKQHALQSSSGNTSSNSLPTSSIPTSQTNISPPPISKDTFPSPPPAKVQEVRRTVRSPNGVTYDVKMSKSFTLPTLYSLRHLHPTKIVFVGYCGLSSNDLSKALNLTQKNQQQRSRRSSQKTNILWPWGNRSGGLFGPSSGDVGCSIDSLSEQNFLRNFLLNEFDSLPVFLDDFILSKFAQFCHYTLWPICHNLVSLLQDVDQDPQNLLFNEVNWSCYQTTNAKYAEIINTNIREDRDVVWINDYHLLLTPLYISRKMRRANVGFFMHSPFPTSEIYRYLPMRKEILRGLLCSDFIGFHFEDYALNFLSSVRRLLSEATTTEIDYGKKWSIGYSNRPITVIARHSSIESTLTKSLCLSSNVRQFANDLISWLEGIRGKEIETPSSASLSRPPSLPVVSGIGQFDQSSSEILSEDGVLSPESVVETNPFRKSSQLKKITTFSTSHLSLLSSSPVIVVSAVDRCERASGLLLKFLAFDFFLSANPLLISKVILIQKVYGVSSDDKTSHRLYSNSGAPLSGAIDFKKECENLVHLINMKHGQLVISLEFSETISYVDRLGLFSISSVYFDTSLKDGFNITPLEFIASHYDLEVKNFSTNETNDDVIDNLHTISVIVSEFSGCSKVLRGASIVNPVSVERSAEVLSQCIRSSFHKEKISRKDLRQLYIEYLNTLREIDEYAIGIPREDTPTCLKESDDHRLSTSHHSSVTSNILVNTSSLIPLTVEQKYIRFHYDLDYIKNNTLLDWARSIVYDMRTSRKETDQMYLGIGFNNFRICGIDDSSFDISKLNTPDLIYSLSRLNTSNGYKLIVCDVEGTLPTIQVTLSSGEVVNYPTREVLQVLTKIAKSSEYIVILVTSAPRHVVETWIDYHVSFMEDFNEIHDLKNSSIIFTAEHGLWYTDMRDSHKTTDYHWKCLISNTLADDMEKEINQFSSAASTTYSSDGEDEGPSRKSPIVDNSEKVIQDLGFGWKKVVLDLMTQYAKRTQGSFVENKGSAIVWKYQIHSQNKTQNLEGQTLNRRISIDPEFARWQSRELCNNLEALIFPKWLNFLSINSGVGFVEVAISGVNKGALIYQLLGEITLLSRKDNRSSGMTNFILCIGDDRSDEKMFEEVDSYVSTVYGEPQPPTYRSDANTTPMTRDLFAVVEEDVADFSENMSNSSSNSPPPVETTTCINNNKVSFESGNKSNVISSDSYNDMPSLILHSDESVLNNNLTGDMTQQRPQTERGGFESRLHKYFVSGGTHGLDVLDLADHQRRNSTELKEEKNKTTTTSPPQFNNSLRRSSRTSNTMLKSKSFASFDLTSKPNMSSLPYAVPIPKGNDWKSTSFSENLCNLAGSIEDNGNDSSILNSSIDAEWPEDIFGPGQKSRAESPVSSSGSAPSDQPYPSVYTVTVGRKAKTRAKFYAASPKDIIFSLLEIEKYIDRQSMDITQ